MFICVFFKVHFIINSSYQLQHWKFRTGTTKEKRTLECSLDLILLYGYFGESLQHVCTGLYG